MSSGPSRSSPDKYQEADTPCLPTLPHLSPLAPRRLLPAAHFLLGCADLEWPLFVGFLLTPALLFGLLGDWQKVSFFSGTAVYLGVLKWLGWLVFTRHGTRGPAYLYFPAEIFVGLAVLCLWFYLRNWLARIWPGSYGLRELTVLPYLAVLLNVVAGLANWRPKPGWRSALLHRFALYFPFVCLLAVACSTVSGVLHVQTTDPIHHALSARVYRYDGLSLPFWDGRPIPYPSGFGAINAVTVAVSPLSVVQVVNLQHILLLMTSLFLITCTVCILAGRSLWLLHSLLPPLLSLFPLHALYPYLNYEATGRQVAPALCIAICTLPILYVGARTAAFCTFLGVEAMLAALTVALNPACAPLAMLACVIALMVLWQRGKALLKYSFWRVGSMQMFLLLLAFGVVLGCDEYYRDVVQSLRGSQFDISEVANGPGEGKKVERNPIFSFSKAVNVVSAMNPVGFSTEADTVVEVYRNARYRNWQGRLPFVAFPWLGLGIGVLALLAGVWNCPSLPGSLLLFLAGCVALWFVVKYALTFLAGGLSFDHSRTALLSTYLLLQATRCEVILMLSCLLAGLGVLFLRTEQLFADGETWRLLKLGLMIPLVAASCGFFAFNVGKQATSSGYLIAPSYPFGGPITATDLSLVRWIKNNIPPSKGRVGLAASTLELGQDGREKHLYPVGPAQALLFYGKHYNFCFNHLDPCFSKPHAKYCNHVRDKLDVPWCLDNGIRYFLVPSRAIQLPANPAEEVYYSKGLHDAIQQGILKREKQLGNTAVYKLEPVQNQ